MTTARPRNRCPQCNHWHRGTGEICRSCRVRNKQEYDEREVALTGGRWVRRGSIRVWDGPRPVETPERAGLLVDTLARNLSADADIHKKSEPTFCVCGCWLLSADEDCPACMARVEWLPWAIEAEARHNRSTYGRAA